MIFKHRSLILLTLVLTLLSGHSLHAQSKKEAPRILIPAGERIQKGNFFPRIKMYTSLGEIIVELRRDKAPTAVNNFLVYVKEEKYDNTLFHRIIPDYIVQGGGYDAEMNDLEAKFKIINESGNGLKNDQYTIAMARMNSPHSASRQFFFNMKDNDNLNPNRRWGYTVFGSVVEGQEVLDAIAGVETHVDPETGLADMPVEDVILNRVIILPDSYAESE